MKTITELNETIAHYENCIKELKRTDHSTFELEYLETKLAKLKLKQDIYYGNKEKKEIDLMSIISYKEE